MSNPISERSPRGKHQRVQSMSSPNQSGLPERPNHYDILIRSYERTKQLPYLPSIRQSISSKPNSSNTSIEPNLIALRNSLPHDLIWNSRPHGGYPHHMQLNKLNKLNNRTFDMPNIQLDSRERKIRASREQERSKPIIRKEYKRKAPWVLRSTPFAINDNNSQFTTGFQNCMYKDTTLFGATKARNRLERNIMNNKKQEVIQHRNLEKLGKKREMVKELYKTYQIKLTGREVEVLNEEELTELAKFRHFQNNQIGSSIKIQRFWRRYLASKIELEKINLRNEAALKIQKCVRHFIKGKTRLLSTLKDFSKSIITIQRFYRGYKVRKEFRNAIEIRKVHNNLRFFENMGNNLKEESSIKIARAWRNYKSLQIFKMTQVKYDLQSPSSTNQGEVTPSERIELMISPAIIPTVPKQHSVNRNTKGSQHSSKKSQKKHIDKRSHTSIYPNGAPNPNYPLPSEKSISHRGSMEDSDYY